MKFITIENTKVAYHDIGEGEVIVLLHGYPQSHKTWRYIIPELSKNFRVIAIDWFGWGDSEKNHDMDFSYEKEINRLNLLLEALNINKLNLFGHDYGGFLSLGYAINFPNKVKRLAILNSRAHKSFTLPWYFIFGLLEKVSRIPLGEYLLMFLPVKSIHRIGFNRSGLNGKSNKDIIKEYISWMGNKKDKKWLFTFFKYYTCKIRPELINGVKNISCPTAIIWGVKDKYIPLSTPQNLQDSIPNSKLTKLNSNHFVMEESPYEVIECLNELLKQEYEDQNVKINSVDLKKTKNSYIDYILNTILLSIPFLFIYKLYKNLNNSGN